ncbi:MAG: glycoside hydrolase family 2 TIM barrel-domain containing protein [Bacteroidota bacterium]
MKTHHWIILLITMIAATWFVYRTRETPPRIDKTIDLNWRFIQGDQKGAASWAYDDSRWRYISIPHDWMIEYPVDQSNPSGLAGGFYPGGIGWYRNYLDLSEYQDKDQFYLLFEGVYMNADVYFNGKHLGKHIYGYTSFYHDVSHLVKRDSLNVIAVRTDCSKLPADRWYSGAGIYRHIRLIATNALHVPVWGTSVTSSLDSMGDASLAVSLELQNQGKKSQRFEIRYDIVDPNGRLVAEGKRTKFMEPGKSDSALNTFRIEDPLLWSPESPQLYTVNCYLTDHNRLIDQVRTIHGIRTVAFDPDHGFLLNGKKVVMKGVCLHHDGGELGAAVPMESWRRRLTSLKELGVNALRLAHNPHAPGLLDLCDQMGFLVIDEMYDKWEIKWNAAAVDIHMKENWEEELANFIKRDRNHPSVVLWSLGNETVEQLDDPARGVEIYRNMLKLAQSVDPSREVTCALHPGYAERGNEIPSRMMHVSPVVSYNYRTDSFKTWHLKYPEAVFIATETKAYGTNRREDYHVIDYSDNSWNDMEEYVAGQFIWAGIDYLGESAGWPDRGFRNGLIQTNGFIKPHAWYIGSHYREDPMVKLTVNDSRMADSLNKLTSWQISWVGPPLVNHWSFQQDPGDKEVVVFTNCEKIDLLLNDSILSTLNRSSFPDGVIRSMVHFEPGNLVAQAFYRDEQGEMQKVSDTLKTAYKAYSLAMQSDRRQISTNSSDVVQITTQVMDSAGVLNPHGRHLVNYRLEGPGKIRVIDNGDLADHTLPGSSSRELRRGKQLLILQAGSEPGDLIISASADGLRPSKVKIKTKD